MLTVTRSHVESLLTQGQNDHHGEGARLRIYRDALLAYKARDDQERQAALNELTREAQEQDHGYRDRQAAFTAAHRVGYHLPEFRGHSSHGLARDEPRV